MGQKIKAFTKHHRRTFYNQMTKVELSVLGFQEQYFSVRLSFYMDCQCSVYCQGPENLGKIIDNEYSRQLSVNLWMIRCIKTSTSTFSNALKFFSSSVHYPAQVPKCN